MAAPIVTGNREQSGRSWIARMPKTEEAAPRCLCIVIHHLRRMQPGFVRVVGRHARYGLGTGLRGRGFATLSSLGEETMVAVDGAELHVITNGPANGPAVVCMPGALGTAETDFAPQLAGLAAGGMRVVSLDPRGYGRSRPPVRDYPVNFYERDADDAAQVMEELGHTSYNVIGWSDGAISAVLHAHKKPSHVECVPSTTTTIFGFPLFFSHLSAPTLALHSFATPANLLLPPPPTTESSSCLVVTPTSRKTTSTLLRRRETWRRTGVSG